MAVWPGTLPSPIVSNYADTPVSAFIRTDMESGTARQRRRFTATPHRLTASWMLTSVQMAAFKSFFESTINFGTDWFTMSIDVGAGITAYDCRFTAPYQANFLGIGNWTVSGQIEIRNA